MVNGSVTGEASPSVTVGSSTLTNGLTAASSSTIVTKASASATVALTGADSARWNVLSGLSTRLPTIGTATVWSSTPGTNVRTPVVVVKSVPAVAVPFVV